MLFPCNEYTPLFSPHQLATQSSLFGQSIGFVPVTPKGYASSHTTLSGLQTSFQQNAHASDSGSTASRKHRIDETTSLTFNTSNETNPEFEPTEPTTRTKDEEAVAYVLAGLALKDRPVVTREELDREWESLTNAQRAAALADLFDQMTVNTAGPSSKKAKKDLDRESINFFIGRMRYEIERIPYSEKEALIEARGKCRSEEFSDSRLEKFLRCEGMNVEVCSRDSIAIFLLHMICSLFRIVSLLR